jgi:hypothetical protein
VLEGFALRGEWDERMQWGALSVVVVVVKMKDT